MNRAAELALGGFRTIRAQQDPAVFESNARHTRAGIDGLLEHRLCAVGFALVRAIRAQIESGVFEKLKVVAPADPGSASIDPQGFMNQSNPGQRSGGNQLFNLTPGSMWRMGVSINGVLLN